jgi:hypothetical protein
MRRWRPRSGCRRDAVDSSRGGRSQGRHGVRARQQTLQRVCIRHRLRHPRVAAGGNRSHAPTGSMAARWGFPSSPQCMIHPKTSCPSGICSPSGWACERPSHRKPPWCSEQQPEALARSATVSRPALLDQNGPYRTRVLTTISSSSTPPPEKYYATSPSTQPGTTNPPEHQKAPNGKSHAPKAGPRLFRCLATSHRCRCSVKRPGSAGGSSYWIPIKGWSVRCAS